MAMESVSDRVLLSRSQVGWSRTRTRSGRRSWRRRAARWPRKVKASDIAAIGITNQRETTVVWDKHTGRPIAPAIVWQCRRTAAYCDALPARDTIERKTGLVIDAYFSASKIRWMIDYSAAHPRDLLFGNVDTWLIWKLTNGVAHVTDPDQRVTHHADASGESGEWDDELLAIFGLPLEMMPKIVRSSGMCGVAAAEHFGAEIPIAGIAGDQQAALFGQACFSPGLSKNTYGTGCFALMHAGRQSAGFETSPSGDPRGVAGSDPAVRRGRQRVHRRRGSTMAARQIANRFHCRGNGGAGFLRSRYGRRVRGPGICRIGRAALGFRRRAASYRASPRQPIGPAWCGPPSKASRIRPRDLVEAMEADSGPETQRAASRRRRDGQQFPDAVSGRHSRMPDRAARRYRNHRARCRISRRPCHGGFSSRGRIIPFLEVRTHVRAEYVRGSTPRTAGRLGPRSAAVQLR